LGLRVAISRRPWGSSLGTALALCVAALATATPVHAGELTAAGFTRYLHEPTASWTETSGEEAVAMEVSRGTATDGEGYFLSGRAADVPSGAASFTMRYDTLPPGTWYVHVLFERYDAATDNYDHTWSNVLPITIPATRKPRLVRARLSLHWGGVYSSIDDRARVRLRVCDDSVGAMLIRVVETERANRYREVRDFTVRPPRSFGARCRTYRLAWRFPSEVGNVADPYRILVRVRDIEFGWSRAKARSWAWADV
jgi:hypothetical protein